MEDTNNNFVLDCDFVLDCEGAQITSLDGLPETITVLYCNNNIIDGEEEPPTKPALDPLD